MLDEWEVYSYAIILLSPWGWWNLRPGALSFNFLYPNKKHLKWKLNPPLHAFSLLFCNIGQGEEIWCVCRSHTYLWKYVSQSSSFKVGLWAPFILQFWTGSRGLMCMYGFDALVFGLKGGLICGIICECWGMVTTSIWVLGNWPTLLETMSYVTREYANLVSGRFMFSPMWNNCVGLIC